MATKSPPTPRQAVLACVTAVLALVMCATACVAAVMAPAPAAAAPVIALVCVGLPVLAAWELPGALRALSARRAGRDAEALAQLRRSLDELPETSHPLGL